MLYLDRMYRIILFIFVCLTVRCVPIFIITAYPSTYSIVSNTAVLFYLIIGVSFLKTWLLSKTKSGFFGGDIWWLDLRLFHSICYLVFVFLFIITKSYFTKLLLFDLVVSFISFFIHYY